MDNARVTQSSFEVMLADASAARATQILTEAILVNNSEARATQVLTEAIIVNNSEARATQLLIEVMLSTVAPPMVTVPLGPRIVISATPVTLPPSAPSIQNIAQVGSTLVAYVSPLGVTGEFEVESIALYRAPFASGPYTLIVAQPLDPYDLINELVDASPIVGRTSYYVATFFDSQGEQSEQSLPVGYAAVP